MYTNTHDTTPWVEPGLEAQTSELHTRLWYRCAGTLAVSAVWLSSITPGTETTEAVTQLAAQNTEIILMQEPTLDFRHASASDAIAQTYKAFHLRSGYYIDSIDSISGFATTWHQYQLLNMLDTARVLNKNPEMNFDSLITQGVTAINTYWDSSPAGYPSGYDAAKNFGLSRPERFVDDNLWMAQFLLHQYQETDNKAYLDRVEKIMDLFMSQSDPVNGGTYWKEQLPGQADHGRVMASNAPAIPILVTMYSLTHDTKYLTAAEQTFAWIQQLRDPETGLYFDNFKSNGQPQKDFYTYNQGEALSAMIALNKVDPSRYPLKSAVTFAQTMMDYFSAQPSDYKDSVFASIYLPPLMHLAATINIPSFTASTSHAIELAKAAFQSPANTLADAAAKATILALSELPFSSWSKL